jgi:hypothetical protein
VIPENMERVMRLVDDEALVLDVGGSAKPLRRADVVLDRYGHLPDGPADTATTRLDAIA